MFLTINLLQEAGIAHIFIVNIQFSYEHGLAQIFVVIFDTLTTAGIALFLL